MWIGITCFLCSAVITVIGYSFVKTAYDSHKWQQDSEQDRRLEVLEKDFSVLKQMNEDEAFNEWDCIMYSSEIFGEPYACFERTDKNGFKHNAPTQ